MKRKEWATVLSQEEIGAGIFSLWLQTQEVGKEAGPGQFVSVYTKDKSKLLPRPISLCEIDREHARLRLVYRITGEHTGTEEFSRLQPGDQVEILGPLGNGFPVEETKGKSVFLIGGGIGIPPMVETGKHIEGDVISIMGYRDAQFLTEELANNGALYIATEDGSTGTKGNVMDAIRENDLHADMIFACGPTPMLRAIKAYAQEAEIPCWISMEEKMACGIGACLACVCRSKEVDGHSHVHNKRICKDGPVFLASEVEL